MAKQKGSRKGNRVSKNRLTYFFLNGELHKKVHINRGEDHLVAFNYDQGKMVGYSYTDARKRAEKAWSTNEVAKMVNRTRLPLETAILSGAIEAPPKTYSFDERGQGNYFGYKWSEKHILELHRYLRSLHRGAPRKDGLITPWPLPTERELRAMIRQETVLYVKNDDGEFVPTWAAEHF